MNEYKIFIDLSADIEGSFVKENNIEFIPMEYKIGEETKTSVFVESDEVMKKFYNAMKDGSITSTSQITPFKYVEFFTPFCEKNIDILYLPLSSGLSQTYTSALLAKDELKAKFPNVKIEIVDTLSATAGIALLAREALNNKNKGLSIEDNAKEISEVVKKLNINFFVEDLKYLKRGGRIKASTAFIAGALNIKPVLIINKEGKLETVAKKHGSKKAASHVVERFLEKYNPDYKTIYISHADAIDMANFIKNKIEEQNLGLDIKIVMISPIIGAHVGPGMCALCAVGK
jgi:DegV family protein with EDD domain